MSATATELTRPYVERKSHVRAAWGAFWSLALRDIVVTIRQFLSFLIEVVLQPLFILFIMGKVLPGMGEVASSFGAILLPGIVALTAFMTALQGVSFELTLDLGYSREIEDRLLSPLPLRLVAIEKVLVAVVRGLIAGGLIFPLAWWILGSDFQVRSDILPELIGMMVLTAMLGASLGLVLGTVVQPEQIGIIIGLVLTPLMFTGCVYNPWGTITLQWFKIVALFNPLTYASEGLRATMLPGALSHAVPTLGLGWVLLAVCGSFIVFLLIGMRAFRNRVVN